MWTVAYAVILFLVPNGLTAPSCAPECDCSERDKLVIINQPSNTSTLINSIRAGYNTWNSSVRLGFNSYYNRIKNVSYSGDNVADIINKLIVIMTQYNFNNVEKRQILWNRTIFEWGGTIEDFIECGNATIVTSSTLLPSTTLQSTIVVVCPSPAGSPDCSDRFELIFVDPDTNSTILTDSIQAVYETWNASMRLGFDTYYNMIRKVLYDDTTTEEEKIDELFVIFHRYNFNNHARRQTLWDIRIGCWGTIEDFILCSNESITTLRPTGASVSPSESSDCRGRPELIFVDPETNSTILTDSIQAVYETWNASMRLGFNTYYNMIRKVLYDDTTTEAEKIDELIVIFHKYNFNNHARRQTLWDVLIGDWGTIEDFILCGDMLNQSVIFWMSLIEFGLSPCTPIIILFLTIERIIYITWPLTKLKYLGLITVVVTIVFFSGNIIAAYLDRIFVCNDNTCESKKTRGALYNYTKMGFGLMNLIAGAVFLLTLHQTRSMVEPLQPAQSTTKRINKIAVLVICLELFLNFLPQLTAFILEQVCLP
ncbi:hypothetical protein DdX_17254 [Ditylenchus destructor]|uniref:Uncharacterized protein n=1 Tax=Ditylenchus destructor TaxID=166010 RepID=A0AAD4MPC6_9BILA|nr:hypothetical protein DdX_17254 [Ditylenchus destructor]